MNGAQRLAHQRNMAKGDHAEQWYEVVLPDGKLKRALEIGTELQANEGTDNIADARRHAEWTRRMTHEMGPNFARMMGIGNELRGFIARGIDGIKDEKPLLRILGDIYDYRAVGMDLLNNEAGIRAAQENRPVKDSDLRILSEEDTKGDRSRRPPFDWDKYLGWVPE